MKKKKKSMIDIIINIIIILLTILIIYWFFELIFGGSPTLTEFNFALIILMAGLLFKIYREIGEIRIGMKHSFYNIKNDMSLIKNKLKIKK